MTVTLADLNPTAMEMARLMAVISECLGALPDDWATATFDAMGADAFDRVEMQISAEFKFRVDLDSALAGTDTAADLLDAIRIGRRLGELPHA
jgi:hypothetical protein